jgi:ubiquinone/menaquinone biosynthesis C-methylase UbiE
MKKTRKHNWLTYRMELSVIRLRDLIRPPTRVLADVGMQRGMTVLDFGCGPGGFSLAAAGIVGREGVVYALDVQRAALESVRRAAARRGINNLHLLLADEISEVPSASVDMVLLYDVLHIDSDPASARALLKTIHRVLKPDGVLSVRDHHLEERPIVTQVTGGGLFRPTEHNRWAFQFEKIAAAETKS